MPASKSEKTDSGKNTQKRKDRVAEVVNTCEWLITAFILAFVFRAFVMEAFRIPTGSMADTLKGAHFRLCCHQCGYKYDHGYVPRSYGEPDDTIPSVSVEVPQTRCPNCGYYWPGRYSGSAARMPVANGDRILVLKCFYQFFEPRRWDVIVFKNPLDPTVNYIKRLVGLPGEELATIDGDVYINGKIARKPPKVQNELWMPVYNNDYQPVRPRQGSFNGHPWRQPFENEAGSMWVTTDADRPTVFRLQSPADRINTLSYNTSVGNDFRATYAYDDVAHYNYMPYCSDLMVRFYAKSGKSAGRIGIALSKYRTDYRAWLNVPGEMALTKVTDGRETTLARKAIDPSAMNRSTLVRFANVDHQLIFQVGRENLTYDLGLGPEDAGPIQEDISPEVKIFGAGELTLWHVAIFRDIHYTARKPANSVDEGRAVQGDSFDLEEDEFFVLGDNSPNSEDSRWWDQKGIGINGRRIYREGTVPRDYLVGKALFVYWPSGFRPFARFPFAAIPNVGQMRFIYGGSTKGAYRAHLEQ